MHFRKQVSSPDLRRFINCFWMIEDDQQTPMKQKIVPDGFPEIIFHTADPYRINIRGSWETQSKSLIAGQLKKYFFLENTGRSAVFGVKFNPAAIALLFNIDMFPLNDRVEDLHACSIPGVDVWIDEIHKSETFDECIRKSEVFLRSKSVGISGSRHLVEDSLQLMFDSYGAITIGELSDKMDIGTRQLELYFRKCVGLSPKFFSRIIRFSRIFELVQNAPPDWADIVHLAGYYDQSHFIKNFTAFTGEEPSRYGFNEENLANFFLKRKN